MKGLIINTSITNKTAILEKYLYDIDKISLISTEEEILLSEKIKTGDKSALDKLVKANLRFVVSVAKKYQYEGLTLEDLISEGNLGLIKAAERFDASRGFKFISFAVWWIRQHIMHALAQKKRMIRLPGNVVNGIGEVNKLSRELEQQLERVPTMEELAEFAGLKEERVSEFLANTEWTLSLDKESDREHNGTLLDLVADGAALIPDEACLKASAHHELNKLLDKLREREQMIIRLYYGIGTDLPMELEDIAKRMNLSKERVRQLKRDSINMLKKFAKAYLLK
nr:RNA polymerase sigma factor RpoD/SigA [Pedobacter panaciterrae]